MTATNVQNILSVYNLANSADIATGLSWYPQAKKAAGIMAARYGIRQETTAAAVIAALSPRNRWERNLQDAENLIAAFAAAGAEGCAGIKVCTFGGNKAKAIKALQEVKTDEQALALLSGPKLKEFYSCIQGINSEVCIDGHAYAIWFGERVTLANVPSIGVKLRREIKADYRQAAEILGVSPAECQAVTWCAWRRLFGVSK